MKQKQIIEAFRADEPVGDTAEIAAFFGAYLDQTDGFPETSTHDLMVHALDHEEDLFVHRDNQLPLTNFVRRGELLALENFDSRLIASVYIPHTYLHYWQYTLPQSPEATALLWSAWVARQKRILSVDPGIQTLPPAERAEAFARFAERVGALLRERGVEG